MALPVGYSRATLRFTGVGVPTGAAVVLCYENTNPEPDMASEAADFFNAWTNIAANQSSDCDLTSVLIKHGPDSTGASAEIGGLAAGAAVGADASPASAVLVHKITAIGGRAGRGRMYVPGLTDDQIVDGGMLDSGSLAAWVGNFADFVTDLNANGIFLMLEHANGSTPTAVIDLSIDAKIATQRRRLRR